MTLDNPLIDRNLKEIRFHATMHNTKYWLECYLHENSLTAKRYTVVERVDINSRGGTNDFEMFETDDLAEAEAKYAAAERRVKLDIADAMR